MKLKTIAIHASLFVIFGVWLIIVGNGITSLAMDSIEYWMPERTYMCYEHSGEFDELFALQLVGKKFQSLGSLFSFGGVCGLLLLAYKKWENAES